MEMTMKSENAVKLGTSKRLTVPRLLPVAIGSESAEQRRLLEPLEPKFAALNIVRTMLHHPKFVEAYLPFSVYVLRNSTLPARDREMLILRTGWLTQSQYEFSGHIRLAKEDGLTDDDVERIKIGPDAKGLDPFDAALLRAADELHVNCFISDDVWVVLRTRYNESQLIDVVMTVGKYRMTCCLLNTAGVALEPHMKPHPMAAG